MTDLEVNKLVSVLLAAFPSSKATLGTSMSYESMLADLDYAVANAAIERLLATSKFLPTIAEIRDACLVLQTGDKMPGGQAWGLVLSAIKRFGSYRQPGVDFDFQDPLVLRCVLMLGWQELCQSENSVADRARFTELYEDLSDSYRVNTLAEGLPAQARLRAARPELPAGKPLGMSTALQAVFKLIGSEKP